MKAIEFIALVLGVTYVGTMSAIFAPLRILAARISPIVLTLMYCPSCFGFYAGMLVAALGFFPHEWLAPTPHEWLSIPVAGTIGMVVSNIWFELLFHGVNPAYQNEQAAHAQTKET